MPRWLAAPLSLFFWASCVLLVILWTPLIAFYRLATFRSDPDRYKVGRLFHSIAVVAVRLNPFWDFRVVDEVHPDPRRPYVFVANHASNADAFLVAMLPWEMKWLSKKSIFDIPLLGWQMRVAGDVEVERGNKESARRAMKELRERLDRNLSIIVFPQGTRSPDGTVGEFREGAFRLAIEAGVDVVPLAVSGTAESLPKGSIAFRETKATVTVLPPVSTKGLALDDAPALAERVRSEIASAISAS
jgi:1-acyl-sn-glycerol-3-phosphate acyltransferase